MAIKIAEARIIVYAPDTWDTEKLEETAERVQSELDFNEDTVLRGLRSHFGNELEYKIES